MEHLLRLLLQDAAPVTVDIPYWKLLLIVALLSVPLLLSGYLGLGLHRTLIVSGVRCVAQLLALGIVLNWLFASDSWWLTAVYLGFMLAVTTFEAMTRSSVTYEGMLGHVSLALVGPAVVTLLYMLVVIIRPPGSWFAAQYAVPLAGMILGNTLNGVSIGTKMLLESVQSERGTLEWALAMGASRSEAIRPLLQRVIRTALTPIINMLTVAGLVSIPGMMTGQILAGDDATSAARYQILILFAVAACSVMSCLVSTVGAAMVLLDGSHRLRTDRLTVLPKGPGPLAAFYWSQLLQTVAALRRKVPAQLSTRSRDGYQELNEGSLQVDVAS